MQCPQCPLCLERQKRRLQLLLQLLCSHPRCCGKSPASYEPLLCFVELSGRNIKLPLFARLGNCEVLDLWRLTMSSQTFTSSDRIRSTRIVQFVQWSLLPTPCHRTNRFKSVWIFPDMLETELLRGKRANWKRFHTVWTGSQDWLASAAFCRFFSTALFILFQSISIDISTNILYIQYNTIYIHSVCSIMCIYIYISMSINCKSSMMVTSSPESTSVAGCPFTESSCISGMVQLDKSW